MKIDSFSINHSQYRKNFPAQGTQGRNFAKKFNETAGLKLSENHSTANAVKPETKSLGHTDKFFISTHKPEKPQIDDTSVMIENAKKAVMRDMTPKSDSAQVQKIKEQIEAGSYEIDVYAIAKKVMEFYSTDE